MVQSSLFTNIAPCWPGRQRATKKKDADFKSSYFPAVLTARCCSSMDLRAGDIMGGGMAGVKGLSGYCAFLPGI